MNNQNIDLNSSSDLEENEKDLKNQLEIAEKKSKTTKQHSEYISKDGSVDLNVDSKNKSKPNPIKANNIRNSIMVYTYKQDKQDKQEKKQVTTANV